MKKMAYRNLPPNKFATNDLSSPQILGVLADLENTIALSVNIYEHFNTEETKAIGRGILALLLDGSKKYTAIKQRACRRSLAHSWPMLLEDCC
jgi:hypothetical protein